MRSSALHLRIHWIMPTDGDITADCVAKAFGVPINTDPRALAILHEWVETTGAEMNEARLRMTCILKGADLILNKVSGTPGFWIGNVCDGGRTLDYAGDAR
jgi:molybdopterin-biosynthesis enzyme MoeA-like protein